MNEDIGIVREIEATRMRYRRHVPARDWTRALGEPAALPVAKEHRITVDCAKPEERKVETVSRPQPDQPRTKRPTRSALAASIPKERWRILETVGEVYGFSVATLLSERRTRQLAYARFAAIRLIRLRLSMSEPDLGRAIKRDHSSIHHALGRAAELLASDPAWAALYRAAEHVLDHGK